MTNTSTPVTQYRILLTFRDTKKSSMVHGDLLKTITIYNFNVGHSNPQDQKLTYEFVKKMKIKIKQKGRKSNGDESLIILLKSPAIMVSGISALFLSSDP